MRIIVAPSMLASDFANLESESSMVNESTADWFHLDVMDGSFVPNISFGMPVISAIKKHAKKPLDVHLMIVEPEKYIEDFAKAGADIISVHYEACPHLHRTIQQISDAGCKPSVAINPHTPVELLEPVINDLFMVCMMSVNPGFGGQKFISHTYGKVKKLKKLIAENEAEALIEIDGGVNADNAPVLAGLGADVLVAGSFVFKSPDPLKTIKELKSI